MTSYGITDRKTGRQIIGDLFPPHRTKTADVHGADGDIIGSNDLKPLLDATSAFVVQGFRFIDGTLFVDTSAAVFRTIWVPAGKKPRFDTSTGELSFS